MLLLCFEARHESGGVSLNMQHEAGSLRKTQTMCVFVFLKSTLFLFSNGAQKSTNQYDSLTLGSYPVPNTIFQFLYCLIIVKHSIQ